MDTDHQLLRDYVTNGSEAAFSELVARHVNLVYSAAIRRTSGDTHLAQDVAQLVFTDLARKARSLPESVVMAGWLHRATRYAAAQLLRTEHRRITREQEAVAMNSILSEADSDSTRSHPTNADWAQIRPLLDEALDELSDDDRDALVLRFFEQRSLAEVGHALGTSEDAARKRVTRALEKLRVDLVRRGITTTAAMLSAAISANAVQTAPVGLAAALSTTALTGNTVFAAAAVTATKTITMTTLQKGIIGAVLATAVGVGIYEAREVSLARAETETLQRQQAPLHQQIAQLTQEQADAGRQLAALRAELERMSYDRAELPRLRGEVAALRSLTNDLAILRAENQRLQAEGDSNESENPLQERVNEAKKILLAMYLYYDSYDPEPALTNLTQLKTYFNGSPEFLPTSNRFELIYSGDPRQLRDPDGTIVIREQQPERGSDDVWSRVYGFGDGHYEIHRLPDGNFEAWEKERMATAPTGR